MLLGDLHLCVCVCTCVFAWLSSCQNKHFSEYLMHTFICVCLSACDNRMSAKTQELMRPFFCARNGLSKVHTALGIISVYDHDCHV